MTLYGIWRELLEKELKQLEIDFCSNFQLLELRNISFYLFIVIVYRFNINIATCCKGVSRISRKMSDEIVSPPAKFKSPVWKYFGFPRVKEGDKVITKETSTVCRLCSHEMKYIKININFNRSN